MRDDRKKQQELVDEICEQQDTGSVINIKNYRPKCIPQLVWRECIKEVWEVDPVNCQNCAGEMKIINFIYQHRVIRRILEHLKIYRNEKKQRPPSLRDKDVRVVETVPFDDGWPRYEEPVFF